MKKLLLILFFVSLSSLVSAQLSISNMGTAYTENFDGIGNTQTASLPAAWKFANNGSSPDYSDVLNTVATTQYGGSLGPGGNVMTSTSTGGTYNFGNGTNSSATDRAIGFLATSGYSGQRSILLQIQNTSCVTITGLTVNFNIEKYRSGTHDYEINFYGSTSPASSWGTALSTTSFPADADNTTVHAPPDSTSKSVSITGLSIPFGSFYYLRWAYKDVSGIYTSSQALAIDNISITASGNASCTGSSTPSTQATSLNISSVTSTSSTLTWTRGNGTRCLVIAKPLTAVSSSPTAGVSYTGNAAYGSGSSLLSGYVVYI